MTMLMEDLHNKMRDIQNLKVTREIQAVSFIMFFNKRFLHSILLFITSFYRLLRYDLISHYVQFLNEGDHEGKKAKEISVLEQTILLMKQVCCFVFFLLI